MEGRLLGLKPRKRGALNMGISNELQIIIWAVGALLSVNVLAMTLFVLFAKMQDSRLKLAIRGIILLLDEFADKMENEEKRYRAIQQINEILGWQKILIPTGLIGWIIDSEVAAIRKMQQSTDTPDLHEDRNAMRKVTLLELNQLALQSKSELWSAAQSVGRDVKLYLHWSAGRYGQFFDEYHINIDKDASIYVSSGNLHTIKSHTYKRNTGAIGISLACCYNATTDSLGYQPPTDMQIEAMSQVIAVLCKALDLTIDIYRVMTHAEAANNMDGLNPDYEVNGYPDGKYGPGFSCERWDLWFIPGVPKGEGGNVLRGKAIWYQQQGVGIF
jgi:hypothetical protein